METAEMGLEKTRTGLQRAELNRSELQGRDVDSIELPSCSRLRASNRGTGGQCR